MRSFYAVQNNIVYQGGWMTVCLWAKKCATTNDPVKIFTARGGEKHARIVAEVTPEMVRIISKGRVLSTRHLHGKK